MITINGIQITEVTPLKNSIGNSIPSHEIAGADDAYLQHTGRNARIFPYEVLVSSAVRAQLLALLDDSLATYSFSDSVNGITATVSVQLYGEFEEAPDVWRINLTLAKENV